MAAPNEASPSPKLHTRLRLWEFADRYLFEPVDGLADLFLSVSRTNGSMNLVEELPPRGPSTNPKVRIVFGVMGVLRLAVGSYCLVITDRNCVGSYMGHAVFKVTGLKALPCHTASLAEQKKTEKEFSELIDAAERSIGLYFSYETNLTLTLQRLYDLGDKFKALPLWRQAEPRFLWNGYLLEPLIESKLDQYLLPVIQGNFQNIHAEVRSEKVNVTMIARRCTRRIGTRCWRRGADPEGYAANFVESEQIMQSKGFTASYVQVRGSMPFLWEQIVDLTYKPSFDVIRVEEAARVLERHFHDLQKKYGAVVAIDLVNSHGAEGRLYKRYEQSIEPILSEDIRFVHFDFHKICGHIHFERLSQLYDQIEDYLKKHKYGKRTTQGILNDLWNALARYYLNNFADGTKQDAMDLLQGHYVSSVSRDITVPGKPGALESFRIAFALVLGAAMFMMISLRQARNDLRHLVVALVWAGLCIGITQYVKKNGRKFCNRPRFFLSRH
ncbi:hypothetical protein ACQ4PT_021412 [Festuca glaucescens]